MNNEKTTQNFTVKVFFRGDWCPWCAAYLNDFNEVQNEINRLGGKLIGITSQVNNESKHNLDLNFDIVSDPDNIEAVKYGVNITPKQETPLADVAGQYEHGMAQPAVIVESSTGNKLYEWIIVPAEMNFGGATDRPLVKDILADIKSALQSGQQAQSGTSKTDMAYLEVNHPTQFQQVQDYLASLSAD